MTLVQSIRFWLDRGQLLVFRAFLRLCDLLLLLPRPRLLWAYLCLWLLEVRHTPYQWPRSFKSVLARQRTGQSVRELVYGETPLCTAVWLFWRAGVRPGSRVVDPCAGRGRALLAARWLGAEARGSEILEEHVALVSSALRRVGVEIAAGDGARAGFQGASHVYLTWTGLEVLTRERFMQSLRRCPAGTRVIAVDIPIDDEAFLAISHHDLLFTWGPVPAWVYERQGPASS